MTLMQVNGRVNKFACAKPMFNVEKELAVHDKLSYVLLLVKYHGTSDLLCRSMAVLQSIAPQEFGLQSSRTILM
jgi:hypothetical protein